MCALTAVCPTFTKTDAEDHPSTQIQHSTQGYGYKTMNTIAWISPLDRIARWIRNTISECDRYFIQWRTTMAFQ